MRIYVIKPIEGHENWVPWYDKSFGFVIRAETEVDARSVASKNHGDEGPDVWMSSAFSTCEILNHDGQSGVILREYASA